jgi:hypothetical protein
MAPKEYRGYELNLTFANISTSIFLVLALIYSLYFCAGARGNSLNKQSYLKSVISHSSGFEQIFFKSLETQKNTAALEEALGLIQNSQAQEFGTVKFPGKTIEKLYSDNGETNAINFRSKLSWHRSFGKPPAIRQVLIFVGTGKSQNTMTIVQTEDNLHVLNFLRTSCGDFTQARFKHNQANKNEMVLEIVEQNRAGSSVTKLYKFSPEKIVELTQNTKD